MGGAWACTIAGAAHHMLVDSLACMCTLRLSYVVHILVSTWAAGEIEGVAAVRSALRLCRQRHAGARLQPMAQRLTKAAPVDCAVTRYGNRIASGLDSVEGSQPWQEF